MWLFFVGGRDKIWATNKSLEFCNGSLQFDPGGKAGETGDKVPNVRYHKNSVIIRKVIISSISTMNYLPLLLSLLLFINRRH